MYCFSFICCIPFSGENLETGSAAGPKQDGEQIKSNSLYELNTS